jgi:hypothetical protein
VDADLSALRQIVRQRLNAGALPHASAERLWAGKGGGGLCSVCDRPIQAPENEYEIVTNDDGAPGGSLLFHRGCLDIWIAESRDRAR